MSDEEHDAEIKEAMKRTPVVVGQPAPEALEALGVSPDGLSVAKSKHDEKESDHNHPTRPRSEGVFHSRMREKGSNHWGKGVSSTCSRGSIRSPLTWLIWGCFPQPFGFGRAAGFWLGRCVHRLLRLEARART